MDELIEKLTSQLGIDASTANGAVGKVMAMIKKYAGDDLFAKISGMIPGAGESAESGAEEESGGGGLMGAIGSLAGGLMGGEAGDAAKLAQGLSSSGLETEKMGGFASTIVEFLKEKCGDEVMDQLLEKVPALKGMLG